MAADLIAEWLDSFRAVGGGYPWYWLGLRLLLDEPLVLIAGLAGVAWSIRRGDRLATGLSLWAGAALLLFSSAGDTQTGDLLLVVLPLSLLAGQAIAGFVDNLTELWTDRRERERALWRKPGLELGLLVSVLLVLIVTLAIWLATYSRMHSVQYLWVALSPVGLMILIILLYGFWGGWRVALRALGTAALTVLLLSSVSAAWGHSLDFSAGRQAGVLLEKGSYGMRSLPETLEILSAQREGDPHEVPIDVITRGPGHELRPVLGWALRDFVSLRWVEDRVPADPASTVVAPEELEVALGDTYAGQDFPLVDVWTPLGLEGKPLWRWVLYREGPASPPTEDVVLWVDVTQPAGGAE